MARSSGTQMGSVLLIVPQLIATGCGSRTALEETAMPHQTGGSSATGGKVGMGTMVSTGGTTSIGGTSSINTIEMGCPEATPVCLQQLRHRDGFLAAYLFDNRRWL